MKKLKLKALQLGATEILTREQLKRIVSGGEAGGAICIPCTNDDGCRSTQECRSSPSCPKIAKVCAKKYWA
ncbi:MAG: hypothetical protein IT249_02765 [Chitinophagaceae bacterium]|nr:hypothetical protein [Chitinophagaceae bacterium]